jgi:DNA-directed RNA polymerase subunit L
LRIRNLPVLGIQADNNIFIPNNIDILNNNNEQDENIGFIDIDNISMKVDNDINISTLQKLTLYLEYENKTDNIVSVGTDDCKFYLKEKQIPSPYPTNTQLIKLQPTQKIKLSAITELGIEDMSAIYSPVSICTFKENSDTDYDLILESKGQLNEKEILNAIYENIIFILNDLLKNLPDNNNLQGELILNNMDHTIGNLLSKGLQGHSSVEFAGYNMPHPLDNNIVLSFKLKKDTLKNITTDVVNFYKDLFQNLNKEIQKIN